MATSASVRPILVTGSHRSGTTWVGRTIAASREVGYIHEPFQVRPLTPGSPALFDLWFTYVCEANGARWQNDLERQFGFRPRPCREIVGFRQPRQAAAFIRRWFRTARYRAERRRALVKDPIALFSAEWLAETFDMDVLVMIRHPAAFTSSIKIANWPHPFDHFVQQPLLMDQHLARFRAQIEDINARSTDIIDRAILLWNLIHHMIAKYRESHPDWLFIRHEDLSSDPMSGYQAIFDRLGLTFTPAVAAAVRKSSQSHNVNPAFYDTVRDSKANIFSWHNRLSDEEIERIRIGTRDIADLFYTAADWGGK